jgi:hypothetical protein
VGEGGDAVDAWHAYVQEDYVGAAVLGGGQGFSAVLGFGDDLDVVSGGEEGG